VGVLVVSGVLHLRRSGGPSGRARPAARTTSGVQHPLQPPPGADGVADGTADQQIRDEA
jgi:hypothetical protein